MKKMGLLGIVAFSIIFISVIFVVWNLFSVRKAMILAENFDSVPDAELEVGEREIQRPFKLLRTQVNLKRATAKPIAQIQKVERVTQPNGMPSNQYLKDELYVRNPVTAVKEKVRENESLKFPLTIGSVDSKIDEEIPSDLFAPFGRILSCQTVVAFDSLQEKTPIIGLVTENLWYDGQILIPAGTEIHGRAHVNEKLHRIESENSWLLVFSGEKNGWELPLSGLALTREKNEDTGSWGVNDGSAGIKGRLVQTKELQELKLLVAEFINGLSEGLKQSDRVLSGDGEVVDFPKISVSNGAISGAQKVLDTYAKRLAKEIDEKGYYIYVPAGTQFYLYVTQTIDLKQVKRGSRLGSDIWVEKEKEDKNA